MNRIATFLGVAWTCWALAAEAPATFPVSEFTFKQLRGTYRTRELDYVVVKGKTNADIGDILGSSPRTVQKHLEHVFEKLGVETRTAAAALASRAITA